MTVPVTAEDQSPFNSTAFGDLAKDISMPPGALPNAASFDYKSKGRLVDVNTGIPHTSSHRRKGSPAGSA